MGVLHSITRFLCCKTEQGKEEEEEEEEESERPLLPHPTLDQHYPPNGDSSKTLPKIIASLIYKALKALLQKVRFIVLYLRRPRKDDPILPVQNPAPTIITNDHPSLPLPISSSSTTSETPPATVNNVYVVSSHEWPTCHISATRKEIADHHLVASDEIIGLTVLLEEIGQGGNVPVAEEEESSREIIVTHSSKGKEELKDERQEEEVIVVKNRVVVDEGRWINHYSSNHRILLVGEGDFSFSASLAVAFGSASNIIATSLNSIEFVNENYRNAPLNIEKLRSRGCRVMHGIDATEMANHSFLRDLKFDRIIFNFPFAGFFKDLSRESQLRRHRRLVSLFMKNAKEMVTSENGEIHISHKTNGFHIEWKLGEIASSHRLGLIEAVKFNHRDYPGYNTKCGFGGDNNFNCNPSQTYKFGLIKSPCC